MKKLTIVAVALAALLAAAAGLAGAATRTHKPKGTVELQFLAVSDWHGQLDPINGVGGAAAIAAYWDQDRANNPNTLAFHAGDAYGATPPISNFFEEVPAVQGLRMMGIAADTFGNHNFDRGTAHLQRMINIGAARRGQPGSPFEYVVANLDNTRRNLHGIEEDAAWFRIQGVKIAVIGAINEEAPELVKPGSFGTLEIDNAVRSVTLRAIKARLQGADVVLVLTHKGVRGFDAAGVPFGELSDFANKVRGVDVIFGDHTDIQYTGTHNGVLVVEARSKGVSYSKTSVTVTRGRVTAKSSQFVVPTAAMVTPRADIAQMIEGYRTQIAPLMSTQIGTSSVAIPRTDSCGNTAGRTCESLEGDVVTDAMRLTYATDFAITNSGGLRADLTCPTTDNSSDFCPAFTPPPYPITRGQANTVLPFGNIIVTLSLSGAELKSFLENGVSLTGVQGRFPQVSGLCFTYDIAAAAGSKVTNVVRQTETGACAGAAVDLTAGTTYTLAINDFMASGGDGYPLVASRVTSRDIMDQAVADWIGANSPVAPVLQGRIVCTDSVAPDNCPVRLS